MVNVKVDAVSRPIACCLYDSFAGNSTKSKFKVLSEINIEALQQHIQLEKVQRRATILVKSVRHLSYFDRLKH